MKHLLILIVSLIAVATIVDAWCGTPNPHSRGKATCIKTACDTEEGRAPYYYTQGSSPIYSFTVNSILFSNDTELTVSFNMSMDALKNKYLSMLGMDLTIRSTFVADEYLEVSAKDNDLHKQMSAKYYKQGEMTVMFSNLINGNIYGYAALFPWEVDTTDLPGYYAMITTTTAVLSGGNTTIFHEVGHMVGLLHVFNEDNECDTCIERPSSPDRNVVGDFCNDTLPMRNEDECESGTLKYSQNCAGESFETVGLPVNNYMSYTGDECQTLGFTPQQVARARCYLATQLSFLTTSTTPAAGTPSTPTGTPSKSNAPAKTSDANSVVVSGAAAVVLAGLAMAL